jgi:hypothetical protein
MGRLERVNPNSPVDMNSYALIEGRARRSEGTETNNLNAVSGAWLWVDNFLDSAATTGIAGCYKPPAYLPSLRRARRSITGLLLNAESGFKRCK